MNVVSSARYVQRAAALMTESRSSLPIGYRWMHVWMDVVRAQRNANSFRSPRFHPTQLDGQTLTDTDTASLRLQPLPVRELRRPIRDLWIRLAGRHKVGLRVLCFFGGGAAGHRGGAGGST